MISIREFSKKNKITMGRTFRTFIGYKVARYSREKNVIYEKKRYYRCLENHFPEELLEEYFKINPVPLKTDFCEPITIEMIDILPIILIRKPITNENLTTDGENIFLGNKWIGYWKI